MSWASALLGRLGQETEEISLNCNRGESCRGGLSLDGMQELEKQEAARGKGIKNGKQGLSCFTTLVAAMGTGGGGECSYRWGL